MVGNLLLVLWPHVENCWYSFRYGDVSPGDSLLGSDLPLQSCKKNKQLVGGADYAHSDA